MELPQKTEKRTSLVVQWLGVCLPIQGTQVQSPVQEDSLCHRATKPMHCNYWAWALARRCHSYRSSHALEPGHNYWIARTATTEAWVLQHWDLQQEKPPQWGAWYCSQSRPCSPQLEKACTRQQRSSTATINTTQ